MNPPKHIAFEINDLRKTGKLAQADPLFCDGLARDGAACQIMAAAVQGDAERLSMLLSDPKVLPDFENAHGLTPLMAAAARGHTAVVDLLAAHPLVNTGRASRDGWTALHYAAWFDESGTAAALIAHHAPLDTKTKSGASPFDVAKDKPVENAFWASRDFARRMKQKHPEHPKFNPAPLPAPEAPEEPAPTPSPVTTATPSPAEKDRLKEAFFRGVASLGLQSMEHPARAKLVGKFAAMTEEELKGVYKTIRETSQFFDWSGVFVAAAQNANIPVMRFLHDQILFDSGTLDSALSAAVRKGDDRNVAHHLVIWGANPDAPFEADNKALNGTIREAAFRRGRTGCFEEMVTWTREPLPKRDIAAYRKALQELPPSALRKAREAVTVAQRRRDFHGCNAKKLREIFKAAAQSQSMPEIMAAYAEGLKGYFLRGTVDFDKPDGGAAIAAALMNEQYELARRLVSHGFHLKDAPVSMQNELRLAGSAQAKKFAEEHLSGKMTVEPIEDAGRAKRAELRILAAGPIIGGARYGMF